MHRIQGSIICKTNTGLYGFILSKVDTTIHDTIIQFSVENEEYHQNGIAVYMYLKRTFSPTDLTAKHQATIDYINIALHDNETIAQFTSRYNRQYILTTACGFKTMLPDVINHYLHTLEEHPYPRMQLYISHVQKLRTSECEKDHSQTSLKLTTLQQDLIQESERHSHNPCHQHR
jgi:hypothetical protein